MQLLLPLTSLAAFGTWLILLNIRKSFRELPFPKTLRPRIAGTLRAAEDIMLLVSAAALLGAVLMVVTGVMSLDDAYRAVNPHMRVPALVLDNHAALTQSLAAAAGLEPALRRDLAGRGDLRADHARHVA